MIEFENSLHPALSASVDRPMARRWIAGVEPNLAYACAWSVLKLYNLVCIREIRVRGQTELPAAPKIIAANHPNVTDSFVVPFVFRGKLSCLAQANIFDIPVLGGLLASAGGIPAVRGRPDAVLAAARRRIEQGYSLYICPEGRLNHGGLLHRGHTGAVRLALSTGAPIVPVGFYVAPRHTHTFRPIVDGVARAGRWQVGGPIYVDIGSAWWPGRELTGQPKAGDYRRLTDRLMTQIATLARQAEARAEA
jgi:1-acyl-sn-glycerol-3-phosphate acyltransferase